jgi:membrane protease YdiL (CAAX protease family)
MSTTQTRARRPSADRTLTGFVRRRPITAFLVWFFTVGQAVAFVPVIAAAKGIELMAQPFIVASTLVGLLLPAVVITRIVDGPERVRELWRRSFAVGVPLRWYVFALVGVPLLATALAVAFFGLPADGSSILTAVVLGLLLQTVLALIPNNLFEEVAWMGFVQARLQDRYRSPLLAALVVGPLFALQHVSLVVGQGTTGLLLLGMLIVLAVPFRATLGWVHNRTGSLFLVGLVHATGNAAAGGSGFGDGFLPRLYPDAGFVGLMHLLAFGVIGLVLIAATRGRLGLPRRTTTQEQS